MLLIFLTAIQFTSVIRFTRFTRFTLIYFQIRLHCEVLGLWPSTYELLKDEIQPNTYQQKTSLPVSVSVSPSVFLFHSLSVSACKCLCVLFFLSLSSSSFTSQDPCICCPLYLESPGFWRQSFFSAQMAPPQVCLPHLQLSSIISLLFFKHAEHVRASGSLSQLFLLFGTRFVHMKALSFTFFRSQLKRHHHRIS